MQVHAFAQKEKVTQVENAADAGARPPAHDHRFDLCQVAFLVIRKALKELFARDEPEDGIAEKLEALVGGQTGVGPGGVRQGGAKQIRLAKLVADDLLALFQDLGFATRGQFLRHDFRTVYALSLTGFLLTLSSSPAIVNVQTGP